MKLSSQIFTLIFVFIAKITLSFTGLDSSSDLTTKDSFSSTHHQVIFSGDLCDLTESDERLEDDSDDDHDDIFNTPSIHQGFELTGDYTGHLFFRQSTIHCGKFLYLLHRNFRI